MSRLLVQRSGKRGVGQAAGGLEVQLLHGILQAGHGRDGRDGRAAEGGGATDAGRVGGCGTHGGGDGVSESLLRMRRGLLGGVWGSNRSSPAA